MPCLLNSVQSDVHLDKYERVKTAQNRHSQDNETNLETTVTAFPQSLSTWDEFLSISGVRLRDLRGNTLHPDSQLDSRSSCKYWNKSMRIDACHSHNIIN